jgi:hypothetical protein
MIISQYSVFDGNVVFTHTDDGEYEYKCKRGLWTVSGASHQRVIREAMNYYEQYLQDGEYV